jgi:hypothetical protein
MREIRLINDRSGLRGALDNAGTYRDAQVFGALGVLTTLGVSLLWLARRLWNH